MTPAPAPAEPNLITISTKQLWFLVATAATSALAILTFGYTQGKQAGAIEAGKELAGLRAIIGKAEADIKIQSDRTLRALETAKQHEAYTAQLNAQIASRDEQIKHFSEHIQKSSGCHFAQNQLTVLEQKIESINHSKKFPTVFGGYSSEQEVSRLRKLDAELQQLQERSLALTQQLGSCP